MDTVALLSAFVALIVAPITAIHLILDVRKMLRDDAESLPTWMRGAWLWVAVFVGSAVLLVAAIGGLLGNSSAAHADVQLWDVKTDSSHESIDHTAIDADGETAVVDQITAWLVARLNPGRSAPLHVEASVPANLAAGIQFTLPPGSDIVVIKPSERGKVRVPYTQAVVESGDPLTIEVRVPGYDLWSFDITPGTASSVNADLQPERVRIGVESFAGSATLGPALSGRLQSMFDVMDPLTLQELRSRIEQEKMDPNDPTQQAWKTALGLDFIVGGGYRDKRN